MRFFATLVVSVALLVSPGALTAQQSNQPAPVFRAGANFVSVDAYPRHNDAIVEDLGPADFQLTEDGKSQTIDSVELIRFDRPPLDFDRRDPNTVGEMWRLAADPQHRLFVAYFDLYHVTRVAAHNARAPVSDFLEQTLGERDLIAFATPDTPPAAITFGRRLEAIRAFLASDWADAERPRTGDEVTIEQCATVGVNDIVAARLRAERALARWRMDRVLTNLRGLVRHLAGIRDGRTNVLLISEGWQYPGPMPDLKNPALVGRCIHEFARLDRVDLELDFEEVIDLAQRSNIGFYAINPSGLITFAKSLSDRTAASGTTTAGLRSRTTMAPSENLRTLALRTGGREVLDTNNLRGGLQRLTSDLSAYYLLGYYSTNRKFDGKYRKIAVRVRRPGIDVTARRGYLAPTPAMFTAAMSTRPSLNPAPPPAVPLIGEPATFVVNTGSAPTRVRDLEFRRTDRIRIEWPRLRAPDRREARLLDRNEQPIPVPLTITEPESTPPVLAIDLPLASFSAGTYIIELMVGSGAEVQKARVTILVTR